MSACTYSSFFINNKTILEIWGHHFTGFGSDSYQSNADFNCFLESLPRVSLAKGHLQKVLSL